MRGRNAEAKCEAARRNRVLVGAVCAFTAAAVFYLYTRAGKEVPRSPETSALSQLGTVGALLQVFKQERSGALPQSLDDLVKAAGPEWEDRCRHFTHPTTGEKYPWLFFPPSISAARNKGILMAAPSFNTPDHNPVRVVLWTDGFASVISEDEFFANTSTPK